MQFCLLCVKGGGAERVGGIVFLFSTSTTSQSASLTAPLTQGSLCCVCGFDFLPRFGGNLYSFGSSRRRPLPHTIVFCESRTFWKQKEHSILIWAYYVLFCYLFFGLFSSASLLFQKKRRRIPKHKLILNTQRFGVLSWGCRGIFELRFLRHRGKVRDNFRTLCGLRQTFL